MINKLPKSLIESAGKILHGNHIDMGIRSGRFSPVGHHIDMGIRGNGFRFYPSLVESIVDWAKGVGRGNFDEFDHLTREHESTLDDDEKNAVNAYTLNSDPIKDHIRSGNQPDIVNVFHEGENVYDVHLGHLDRAISKNKLKEPLVTYSGMQRSPWDNGHSMFHTATPMSSSLDPLVAHQFSISYGNDVAHIAKITNMKGSAGLLVGANKNLTPSPCEMEYIIPRNTNFVVHPEPEEVKGNNGKLTHYIWNMRRC